MNTRRSKHLATSAPGRFIFIVLALTISASASTEEALIYGVQPFIPPLYLERSYGPLIQALSEELDRPVQLRTRRSVLEYRSAIDNEVFDIILVNPFAYVALQGQSNYRGLVRRTGEIKARFFVVDPAIDSLEKLRGRDIGVPPLQMANTILGLQTLHDAGMEPDQYQRRVYNEHVSCKQALSTGQVDACVSSPLFTRNRLQHYDREFIPIADSRGIPSSVIMIHQRISALEEPLRDWFLNLNQTEHGRAILDSAILGELGPLNAADYDVVLEIEEERVREAW